MRNSDTDTKASEEEMPTVKEEKYKIWLTSYSAFRLEYESRRVRRLSKGAETSARQTRAD